MRQVSSSGWPVFSLVFQRFAPWRFLSSAVPPSFVWSFGAGSNMAPRWLSGKESACNAGDMGSIPGSGRSPGEGNGNPLQQSCLGSPTDREAWWVTTHAVAELDRDQVTKQQQPVWVQLCSLLRGHSGRSKYSSILCSETLGAGSRSRTTPSSHSPILSLSFFASGSEVSPSLAWGFSRLESGTSSLCVFFPYLI